MPDEMADQDLSEQDQETPYRNLSLQLSNRAIPVP
jgi:hypothetical protein